MSIIVDASRIDTLMNAIIKVAAGDFSVQIEISDVNDHFDAIAMGINMMVDDLKLSFETKKENERINELNKQLQIALVKAEESDRLKSAFLANMSHEIRTPMNGILGFAKLLQEPLVSTEDQKMYINVIEKSGQRMLNIINDIIDISKIEAGQSEVSISSTVINEQLEYTYTFFKPEAEKKGIRLLMSITLPKKESIINTDREKLYAILTNLTKNAIKFTNKGTIRVGYEKNDDFFLFFVEDTGIGISPAMQQVIFNRFRQADIKLTSEYEGSGLGLTISKAYTEMLGGKMWVKSTEGQGSTFYFTLPCNQEINENNPIDVPIQLNKVTIVNNNLKILIVEDNDDSLILLKVVLNKYFNDILIARDGLEAVETCRKYPKIDLILMDMRLPKIDGYEATEQIRQFNKDVVIIAQTAFGLTGDREKAMKSGCNDYLSKPINTTLLISTINKYFTIPEID